MSASEIKLESIAYPAAIGAGVAYSMYGTQPVPLAVGAAAGYFGYMPLSTIAISLPLPAAVTAFAPEILAGGVIGYNLYGGRWGYVAAGAAAGYGFKLLATALLVKELGGKL